MEEGTARFNMGGVVERESSHYRQRPVEEGTASVIKLINVCAVTKSYRQRPVEEGTASIVTYRDGKQRGV